jgi:hypothetical protein
VRDLLLAGSIAIALSACTPGIDAACTSTAQCRSDEECADGLCIRSVLLHPDAGGQDDDAGTTDAGSGDAGSSDGGSSDAGPRDGGSSDAGLSDGGSSDAGTVDGGSQDGGAGDGGTHPLTGFRLESGAFGTGAAMKSTNYQFIGSMGPLEGTAHSANHKLDAARSVRTGQTR